MTTDNRDILSELMATESKSETGSVHQILAIGNKNVTGGLELHADEEYNSDYEVDIEETVGKPKAGFEETKVNIAEDSKSDLVGQPETLANNAEMLKTDLKEAEKDTEYESDKTETNKAEPDEHAKAPDTKARSKSVEVPIVKKEINTGKEIDAKYSSSPKPETKLSSTIARFFGKVTSFYFLHPSLPRLYLHLQNHSFDEHSFPDFVPRQQSLNFTLYIELSLFCHKVPIYIHLQMV